MRSAASLTLSLTIGVVMLACGGRTQDAPASGCEANTADGGTELTIGGATVTLRSVMGVVDEDGQLGGVVFSESADGCRLWLDSVSSQQNQTYFLIAATELSRVSAAPVALPINSSGSTVAVVASGCGGNVTPQKAIGGSLSIGVFHAPVRIAGTLDAVLAGGQRLTLPFDTCFCTTDHECSSRL